MRIERLEVGGFGVLKDFTVELDRTAPIVVLHGANEAGKSTLMQFIRAVLFGFAQRNHIERHEPTEGGVHGGALVLRDRMERVIRVQRYDAPGVHGRRASSGEVHVTTSDGASGGEELLRQVIGGVTADVYKHVYAFGLTELQEVRTLQSEEIGGFLYGAGYGVNGTAVLEAEKWLHAEMEQLFRPRGKKQIIGQLTAQLEELDARIRHSRGTVDQYEAHLAQRDELDTRISEARHELREQEERLQWISMCLSAQESWKQLREAERELSELRERLPVAAMPPDALRSYEEETLRLEELRGLRMRMAVRLDELLQQAAAGAPNELLLGKQREIAELEEQAAFVAALVPELDDAVQEEARLAEQIHTLIARIDSAWTEEHLARLNISLAERDVAREYRDRMATLHRQLEAAYTELDRLRADQLRQTKRLGVAREQAAEAERVLRMAGVGRLAEVSALERRELLQRLNRALAAWRQAEWEAQAAARRWQEEERRKGKWRRVLVVFSMLTVTMPAALFLISDPLAAAAAAAVLLASGFTLYFLNGDRSSAGLRHRRDAEQEKKRRIQDTHELLGELLTDAERAVAAASAGGRDETDGAADEAWTVEAAAELVEQLELACERLQDQELRCARLRDEAAALASQADDVQERYEDEEKRRSALEDQLEETMRAWRGWLENRQLSLDLTPDTVLELFAVAEQAKQLMRNRDAIRIRIAGYKDRIADFERRAANVCSELSLPDIMGIPASEAVRRLVELIAAEVELAERRATLSAQYAERQEEVAQLEDRIRQSMERLEKLQQAAGAADEAEFRRLAAADERSRELQLQARQHMTQLEWLVTAGQLDKLRHTLEHTGGAELAAERTALLAEVAEKRRQIDESLAARAKLQVVLDELASGAEHAELLQQKEERLTELHRHAAAYMKYAMAEGLLRRTRELYERERQPRVLREASRYMSAITGGRYERIIAPLGERKLLVERHNGEQIDASLLSRGTREQLYLAMRFALVEAYAIQHDPLPIVLDDILVNFDEARAARCLDVMRELASRHQIMMFTCHDHMRRMVEARLPEAQVITWGN